MSVVKEEVIKYVTLNEAVAMGFGSRSTLLRRKDAGVLHPEKRHGRLYFSLDELRDKMGETKVDDESYAQLIREIVDKAPRMSRDQALEVIGYLFKHAVS